MMPNGLKIASLIKESHIKLQLFSVYVCVYCSRWSFVLEAILLLCRWLVLVPLGGSKTSPRPVVKMRIWLLVAFRRDWVSGISIHK